MLKLNKCTHKLNIDLNQHSALRTAHVCVSLCTIVVHNTAQNSSDNFPVILQTIITAQMMSTREEGGTRWKLQSNHSHTLSLLYCCFSTTTCYFLHCVTACKSCLEFRPIWQPDGLFLQLGLIAALAKLKWLIATDGV